MALPWVLALSFLWWLPSLQTITARYSAMLGAIAKSTLADLLNNGRIARLMAALWQAVEPADDTNRGRLLAVDSMPVTMPATRRTNAAKLNNNTRGIGLMWSVALDAPGGQIPVRIIHIPLKACNDSRLLRQHDLTPNGPVYLLDRGFYCFELIDKLLGDQVRFIMRARKHQMRYQIQKQLSNPRRLASGIAVELDALVTLGSGARGPHPRVRLIRAYLPPRGDAEPEDLFLVTPPSAASATKILDDYRRRDEIEKFHQALKSSLGLAHLYSFQVNGIQTLVYAALMLATCILVMTKDADPAQLHATMTIASLIILALNALRDTKHIQRPWKRNISTKRRWKKRKPPNPRGKK